MVGPDHEEEEEVVVGSVVVKGGQLVSGTRLSASRDFNNSKSINWLNITMESPMLRAVSEGRVLILLELEMFSS